MKRSDKSYFSQKTPDRRHYFSRPQSPYIYNKEQSTARFDEDKRFLQYQYESNLLHRQPSQSVAKFIRPVSLATLKNLTVSKNSQDGYYLISLPNENTTNAKKKFKSNLDKPSNILFTRDRLDSRQFTAEGDYQMKTSPLLLKDDFVKRIDIPSINLKSKFDDGFLYCARSISSGTVYHRNALKDSSKEQGFNTLNRNIHSSLKTNFFLHQPFPLRRPKLDRNHEIIPENNEQNHLIRRFDKSDFEKGFINNADHNNLRKYTTVSNEPITISRDSNLSFINKLKSHELASKHIKTNYNNYYHNPTNTPEPPTIAYRKIKLELETCKRNLMQETNFSQAVSKFLTEDNEDCTEENNRNMLTVTTGGKLHYAISVRHPSFHSVSIFKQQKVEKDGVQDKDRPIIMSLECKTSSNSNEDGIKLPQTIIIDDVGEMLEKNENSVHNVSNMQCKQSPINLSRPNIVVQQNIVHTNSEQIEFDSGHGTDEDDFIDKNSLNILNTNSDLKPTSQDNEETCSQTSGSLVNELDEGFSDQDEDNNDENNNEEENDDKDDEDERQSNEEAVVIFTNSDAILTTDQELSDLEDLHSQLELSTHTDINRNKSDQIIPSEIKLNSNKINSCGDHQLLDHKISNALYKYESNINLNKLDSPKFILSNFSITKDKFSKLSIRLKDTQIDIPSSPTKPDGTKSEIRFGTSVSKIDLKERCFSSLSTKSDSPSQNILTCKVVKQSEDIETSTNLKHHSDSNSKTVAQFTSELFQEKQRKSPTESQIKQTSNLKETSSKIRRSNFGRSGQQTRKSHPALIDSLFPYVPPVIRFVEEGQRLESLPWEFRRLLRWRASLLTPLVVRQALLRTGFRVSKLTTATEDLETIESSDWIFYFGKHMRPQIFRSLKEYQKVNHLPCSFQLGRKDRLWKNILHMQSRFGKDKFNYIPQTFCLPGDLEALKKAWDDGGQNQRWILKPPASARGIGVRLVTKWAQVPKKRPTIVQRYLSRPFLINESKFDLRIYVYISSINPLRLYIHEDGLVRFASQKYTNSVRCLGNRFVHLTNYSINRLNSEYVSNTNETAAKGHKWSLKALWAYFKEQGISPASVWASIKDVVVKTAISTEAAFNLAINSYCNHSCSVHEIFGFDIFLDEDLQPWLLEVNVSPSMHSDSLLDAKIKGNVIKDMLNISGLRLPDISESMQYTITQPTYNNKSVSNSTTTSELTYPITPNYNKDLDPLTNYHYSSNNDQCKISQSKQCESRNSTNNFDNLDNLSIRKNVNKKLIAPNHEWYLDERLLIQSLSLDEIDKQRYYHLLAINYGLPKLYNKNGNIINCMQLINNHNNNMIMNKFTTNQSRTTSTNLFKSPKSSSLSIHLTDNDILNSSISSSSSSSSPSSSSSTSSSDTEEDINQSFISHNSIQDVRKSSGHLSNSKGIGPASPDLRSHRNSLIKETITRHYTPNKGYTNSKLFRSRTSTNTLKSAARCKSSSSYNDSKHLSPTRSSSSTLPRVRLANATAGILDCLTPSDVRTLINMVDEFERVGGFECIFPPTSAGLAVRYLSFFEVPRYANMLCIAYLQKYSHDKEKGIQMLRKLCETKIHLKSASNGDNIDSEHQWHNYVENKSIPNRELIDEQIMKIINNNNNNNINNSYKNKVTNLKSTNQ